MLDEILKDSESISQTLRYRCVRGLASYEEYILAVTESGIMLKYVPYSLITQELCELAITKCPQVFEMIPDSFKTKELCKLAIKLAMSRRHQPSFWYTNKAFIAYCIQYIRQCVTV